MVAINANELGRQVNELLDRVSRGEEITIERGGAPVARIVSARHSGDADNKTLIKTMMREAATRPASQAEIQAWIREGRDD